MTWKMVKLGEIITESRIPSVNPDPNKRITVRLNLLGVEKRPLENEKAGATKQFIRKAGQFIYGKQNFHKGAFGIIPDELDGFESSADLPSFDVRKDCLPEWIFYFFKQGDFYLELAKIARGVATQRIHPEQIYDLEIPLPDIETQKKIIASIKAIEEKGVKLKNELSRQLTLIDQLNQAILQEAVQGKLVPQDPKDEPASELLKRIKAEKATLRQAQGKGKKEKPLPPIKAEEIPFEIPENWVWCRLGEICEINPRNNVDDEIDAGFIPMSMVSQLFGVKPSYEVRKWGEIKTGFTHFANNDVVVAKITPCFENSKAGIISDLPNGVGAGTTELNVLRGNQFVLPEYIYSFVKRIDFLKNGERIMKGVAGQKRVPTEYFYNTLIPLPPLSEQKRIVAEIEKQFTKTKQLKEHIIANQQATEQLLKALLHQAFEVREVEEVNS